MIVHATMRPGVPIEVDAAEYTDLSRQGLLLPEVPAPLAAPVDASTSLVPAVQSEPDTQEKPA